ncbi:MAG: S8 family peptidase [Candidatus Zixiibacteriota bacterium]|nr:MAG: S8 family peptidase [candidate division Zixibacteria bacterium]
MPGLSRKFSAVIVSVVCLLLAVSLARGTSFSPSLEKLMSGAERPDSLVSVVVFADNSAGTETARRAAMRPDMSLKEKHRLVIESLKSAHAATLENLVKSLRVICPETPIKRHWIAPAVSFRIPVTMLAELMSLPGVASVIEDAPVEFIKPVETIPRAVKAGDVRSHLTSLNIPALWRRGLNGRGRLVCNFDTGVEGTHPALQERWRGRHASNAASWFAPSSIDTMPFDKTGHGTHTMGLMVGAAESDSFGVAPGAEWIAAAVIDQGQTLSRTISDILAGFEWAADPDGDPSTIDDMPDVLLNSWGIPTSVMEPCDPTFYQAIDNVEAAGVVTIFAAGNEGPNPQSLRIPANRAGSPLNSFAVGAIDDATNIVADFSSRGPSSCDATQKKPEVVAPGVAIFSSTKGGTYIFKSGTSMAAPLIAGMVALLRQYNPDATVEEIKTAIIQSSRDLGPNGEDNDYGHGLPDAELALSLVPAPPVPSVYIANQIIAGDGIAEPGETFDFYVRLEVPGGELDSLTAYLNCSVEGVNIINDHAAFIFESKSVYSMNISPYVINFDNELVHGQTVPFSLHLHFPFSDKIDTLDFDLSVGYAPVGNIVTHATQSLEFSVTDFGQYGLGANSIYPAGGAGLTFRGSDNFLYEAGIIVGRNSLQLSSSVRDSLGRPFPPDFNPSAEPIIEESGYNGSLESRCRFSDNNSDIPIPITVAQNVTSCDQSDHDRYVIMQYYLVNNSNEYINGVYFGLMTDFDLSTSGDRLNVLPESNLIYQLGDSVIIGLMPLTGFNGMKSLDNGEDKIPLDSQDKFTLISQGGIDLNTAWRSDHMTVLSFGPFSVQPHDSVEIALTIAVSDNLADLQLSAARALEKYLNHTGISDHHHALPRDFTLYQNYPNPFNPATTISFDVARTSSVELRVFNGLGQFVAVLFNGLAHPGNYRIVWDGRDQTGHKVASGIYFYRLRTETAVQTKKMLLIK